MRAPGRREIGHGAWRKSAPSFTAERRFSQIRVVPEILPTVPPLCSQFMAPRWR